MSELNGKRVLIFVEEYYEDLELWYPKIRLEEAGAEVLVAGPQTGKVYKGKNGYPCTADITIDAVDHTTFDALVLCGGWAPDKLRRNARVLEITKAMHDSGKPIAHICHAGWVPISAGIMKGIRCTSVNAIRDDLQNAGAEWVDQAVVVDKNHITSRTPKDLAPFCLAIIEMMKS